MFTQAATLYTGRPRHFCEAVIRLQEMFRESLRL